MRMKKSLTYLKHVKKQLILGPIFKLIEAIFELLIPMIMAYIIDHGLTVNDQGYVIAGNQRFILTMGCVILVMGILGLCSSLVCQFYASRASQGYGTVLRNELFAHIHSLSFQELDQIGSANLVTIMTNDINQLQLAVAMFIRLVIRAPFLIIGSVVMAFIINVYVGLIFVAIIPILSIILYVTMKKSAKRYPVIQNQLDVLSNTTMENLSGARVIKAFVRQENEMQRFEKETTTFQNESNRVAKITAFLNPLTFACINLAILAVLYFGGRQIQIGNLSQGDVIALVNYMNQILLALIVVSNLVVIFTKAKTSLQRCELLFSKTSSILDEKEVPTYDENAPLFVFDKVSFQYPLSENEVIHHISFSIQKGETIGMIGGTGAGKTTILNLIERFYDCTKGSIYYKGQEIQKTPLSLLRKDIAQVFQKNTLFKGTIRSNLKMKNPQASDEEIITALKLACAYDFCKEYDDFLDHAVEEGGKNFSGGQRQRLCIARAILDKASLLILDDATSALDYLTDKTVRENLKHLPFHPSILLVSQRAHSIQYADKILVIDGGEIVGMGTHQELLQKCKVYQEIVQSQQQSGVSHA